MNPYGSFAGGQYGDAAVMREMQRSGGYQPPYEANGFPMNSMMQMNDNPGRSMGMNPWASNASIMPGMAPMGMMTANPNMMNQMARGPMGVFPTGYVEDFSQMPPPMSRGQPQVYDPMPYIPGEVVVAERIDAPQFLGQQVVGQEWVYGVKPYVTMERVVEVPQTIVKESTRYVPKPEIVERIIEVPKIGYNERTRKAAPTTQYVENIAEVDRGCVTETRQQHIPRTEYQERLIEIPKMEFRERIEYEDFIEYREVPVDKIVEVPEIEYVIKDVERFVNQTYVQEYFVDRYTEVPIQQVQEVERFEHVPVVQPVPNYRAVGIPVPMPMQPPAPYGVPVPVPYGVPVGVPTPVPVPVPHPVPVQTMPAMQTVMTPPMPVQTQMPIHTIPPAPVQTLPMMSQRMVAPPGQTMPMQSMPMQSMMNTAPRMPSMPNMMNTAPMMPMSGTSMGNAYASYDPGRR